MRALITYGAFPVTFSAALIGAHLAFRAGHPPAAILAVVAGATVAIVALCERLAPAHAAWNRARGDVGTDALHALVSMIALPPLFAVALQAGLLSAAVALSEAAGGQLWPSQLPIAAQVALALLVSQFGEYWVHRAMHEIPLLWRLHATHHSPHRLYWLNAARFHPLDTAASYAAATAPLVLLGAPAEILLLYTTWVAVHGLFQHANIHVRLGPLNYVFSMAELHRWHHSKVLAEANANYGNNIILFDLIFGTFFWPRDRDASATVGLHDMDAFPQDYVGQLASPWRWRQIAQRGGAAPPPAP